VHSESLIIIDFLSSWAEMIFGQHMLLGNYLNEQIFRIMEILPENIQTSLLKTELEIFCL